MDTNGGGFDGRKIRESLKPFMSQSEMARRMEVSQTFLSEMERGRTPWPEIRQDQYLQEVALWKEDPDAKPRRHWGRKRGCLADGTPSKRVGTMSHVNRPVPHKHGEIVGIG
jgi:hypothetical protein